MWECVGMCAGCVCVTCVWYVCTEQSRMNTLSVKHGFQHTSKGKHQQQVETHTDSTHTPHTPHTHTHIHHVHTSRTYLHSYIHTHTPNDSTSNMLRDSEETFSFICLNNIPMAFATLICRCVHVSVCGASSSSSAAAAAITSSSSSCDRRYINRCT